MSLLAKPSQPILCYVTDRRSLPLSTSADAHHLLFDSVERAAAAGVDWIQLREKDFSGREWEELVRESLRRISRAGAATRILVNDRLDVALACGAGGVHLSENGIPVAEPATCATMFFPERAKSAIFLSAFPAIPWGLRWERHAPVRIISISARFFTRRRRPIMAHRRGSNGSRRSRKRYLFR